MRIVEQYSHLNGLEYLLVHRPHLWSDICSAIDAVDAEACRTKVSAEKTMEGRLLFSPRELNEAFKAEFKLNGWSESKVHYWITDDADLIRRTLPLPPEKQRAEIEAAGKIPMRSHNQTDFVKERVAVEVQFGKYAFVAHDLFVKHLAFYVGNQIDVGVEVLPMKKLQMEMSSGVSYYEGALYNVVRQGRGVPSVPLVLVGIS